MAFFFSTCTQAKDHQRSGRSGLCILLVIGIIIIAVALLLHCSLEEYGNNCTASRACNCTEIWVHVYLYIETWTCPPCCLFVLLFLFLFLFFVFSPVWRSVFVVMHVEWRCICVGWLWKHESTVDLWVGRVYAIISHVVWCAFQYACVYIWLVFVSALVFVLRFSDCILAVCRRVALVRH